MTEGNGRDDKGKFSAGNSFGRGNPMTQRVSAIRKVLREAVTDGDYQAIVGKMVEQAKEGDAAARKELFDRCIGKPTPTPHDACPLDLPELTDTASIVEASSRVLAAVSEGALDVDQARKIGELIEISRRGIELHDLGERIRTLEKMLEETRR